MTHTQDSAPRCETCRYGREVEAWRKQARNALPGKVIECLRVPIAVLKLPRDWCGEHSPRATLTHQATPQSDEGEG